MFIFCNEACLIEIYFYSEFCDRKENWWLLRCHIYCLQYSWMLNIFHGINRVLWLFFGDKGIRKSVTLCQLCQHELIQMIINEQWNDVLHLSGVQWKNSYQNHQNGHYFFLAIHRPHLLLFTFSTSTTVAKTFLTTITFMHGHVHIA